VEGFCLFLVCFIFISMNLFILLQVDLLFVIYYRICLCLSQSRTFISNITCHGHFLVSMIWSERWLLVFIDIGGNIDQLCLNFLFIIIFQDQLVLSQKKTMYCLLFYILFLFLFFIFVLFCHWRSGNKDGLSLVVTRKILKLLILKYHITKLNKTTINYHIRMTVRLSWHKDDNKGRNHSY